MCVQFDEMFSFLLNNPLKEFGGWSVSDWMYFAVLVRNRNVTLSEKSFQYTAMVQTKLQGYVEDSKFVDFIQGK